MEDKKRVAILITIALILAITAITLSATDSNVPTQQPQEISTGGPTGAVIGLQVQHPEIEDKLSENPQ